jgi:integrase
VTITLQDKQVLREICRNATKFPNELVTFIPNHLIKTATELVEAGATLHLQNGSPLEWVKNQLGHASIRMTVDCYFHYLPSAGGSGHSNKLPSVQIGNLGRNVVNFK